MSLCASWKEGRPYEELSPPKILIAIFTSLQLFQHATDLFGEKVIVKQDQIFGKGHVIPLTIIKQLKFVKPPGNSLPGCKYPQKIITHLQTKVQKSQGVREN